LLSSLIFSSVLAYFLFSLKILSNRLRFGTSGCRVPATGGPCDASGSHLLIG
jgi:hypothetical protein